VRRVEYKYIYARNGVERGELLAPKDNPPTISMQTEAEIPSSMQATYLYNADVDYLLDRVRPYMLLDGQWRQIGEYVASSVQETYTMGARRVEVELMDQASGDRGRLFYCPWHALYRRGAAAPYTVWRAPHPSRPL